jgi:hypothetical protein
MLSLPTNGNLNLCESLPGREMSETLDTAVFAVSFLLSIILTGALWYLTARFADARQLWGFLAIAWTLNLVADIGWGIYGMLGGEGQPSWTDALYMVRYLMVLLAFWFYPTAWPLRKGLGILTTMAATVLVFWIALILPFQALAVWPLEDVLGGLIYPVLDAAVITAAWSRWRGTPSGSLRRVMVFLFIAMLVYGTANWLNYGARMVASDVESILPTIFWSLINVFAGLAVWRFLKRE